MPLYYDDNGARDVQDLGLDSNAIDIFLDPGEYFVGDASFQVRTLLGSCVSIILWHPRLRYGAMSHFLLISRSRGSQAPHSQSDAGKYGDEGLAVMLREMREAGVPLDQCQAKVFGGGNMFPGQPSHAQLNIGLKNGDGAKRLLAQHGIPLVAEDLYGDGHREIIFNLSTGDVWVRQKPIIVAARVGDRRAPHAI